MKQIDLIKFIKEHTTKTNKIILACVLLAILFLILF